MTKRADLPEFSQALNHALVAADAQEFMESVRGGYSALYRALMVQSRERQRQLEVLDNFFADNVHRPRLRRIAEVCAWPIFDKPSLPHEAGEAPEFLWLFALPFVVTFSQAQLSAPVFLEGEAVDANDLLAFTEQAGVLNAKARLRAFSTLFRRDDLHAYGPQGLARAFIDAELGGESVPQPLPLQLDPELESHRTVVYFAACAARLPVGESQLILKSPVWSSENPAHLVKQGLLQQGLGVEHVQSLPPCSMAEALFHCTGPGLAELESNLLEARRLYGELQVLIKHPMDGFAEINAVTDTGQEIMLLPSFAFFEPKQELQHCVKALCQQHQLGYKGAYVLASQSSMLQ